MTRDGLLIAHILLGVSGLLLGPAVLIDHGRVRHIAAYAYQLTVAGVTISALLLAATAFARLWWLVPVAVATQAAALLGLLAWRQRRPGWPTACAHLLGGSYVALVTGVLIAGTGNPVSGCCPRSSRSGPSTSQSAGSPRWTGLDLSWWSHERRAARPP